jgi:hypothetical protein
VASTHVVHATHPDKTAASGTATVAAASASGSEG